MKRFVDEWYKKLILSTETKPSIQPDPVPDIAKLIEALFCLSDEEWGEYLFSREIAGGRIKENLKKTMIQKAILCGKEYVRKIKMEYGNISPSVLADKMQIQVTFRHEELNDNFFIFSQFIPPKCIVIFPIYIERAKPFLEMLKKQKTWGNFSIKNILLAHELFHFIEERDKNFIFTRTEKMELWTIGPFKGISPIFCLGEIAAMIFAKELCGLLIPANIIDVILTYGCNPYKSLQICKKMLRFHKSYSC
ncbi:MAG: hypothetical protein LBG22_01855 [Treponema sp.]|jgi:hypothetical protein|nr:hypothetical protein [Treponema sp.]